MEVVHSVRYNSEILGLEGFYKSYIIDTRSSTTLWNSGVSVFFIYPSPLKDTNREAGRA